MAKLGREIFCVLVGGLICITGCEGHNQSVNGKEIYSAFQDVVSTTLNLQPSLGELTDLEIKEKILPNAAGIIANTIKLVRERTGDNIDVADVLSAVSPEVEKALMANAEQLTAQVKSILEKK